MFCKPMLYFGVCLSLRALIAYAFYRGAPARFLPIMGVLAIMVAIGFMLIYLFEWRQGSTTETGKGCTVWWNDLRPIHAVLYLLAGVSTLMYWKQGNGGGKIEGRPRWLGSLFLSMDVCIGVVYKIIKMWN
jgi:hypothetical protein